MQKYEYPLDALWLPGHSVAPWADCTRAGTVARTRTIRRPRERVLLQLVPSRESSVCMCVFIGHNTVKIHGAVCLRDSLRHILVEIRRLTSLNLG
jgi:hypothetical protein